MSVLNMMHLFEYAMAMGHQLLYVASSLLTAQHLARAQGRVHPRMIRGAQLYGAAGRRCPPGARGGGGAWERMGYGELG